MEPATYAPRAYIPFHPAVKSSQPRFYAFRDSVALLNTATVNALGMAKCHELVCKIT